MNIGILTEANVSAGYGHVYRCISIGQAKLRERGHSLRFIIHGDDKLSGITRPEVASFYDWYAEKDRLKKDVEKMDVLLIDGISIPDELLFQLTARKKCAIIDDFKRRQYSAGLIIDWTILATTSYPANTDGQLGFLLGPHYAALRKAFWEVQPREEKDSIENILITFGGTDLRGLTAKAMGWIASLRFDGLMTVIVGNGTGDRDAIQKLASDKVRILVQIGETEMASAMARSDLAVTAGGQTLYELARIGVPSLAITVADNQVEDVKGWEKAGFLIHVGEWDDPKLFEGIKRGFAYFASKENRLKHSTIGRATIDGQGARRIAEALEAYVLKT